MSELLRAIDVRKSYRTGSGGSLEVLKGADLAVEAGELVAVVGSSGVGKSTLLHLLGGLDRPDSGRVILEGEELYRTSATDLAERRNRRIGFVFQFHSLLPEFDAVENVMIPMLIGRKDRTNARSRSIELLESLGLGERLDHYPSELSGGEQQRVAVARALANEPGLVLADEPTGNLDPATGEAVFNIFHTLQESRRFAAVLATHNEQLARRCARILQIEEGKLIGVRWEDVRWTQHSPNRKALGG